MENRRFAELLGFLNHENPLFSVPMGRNASLSEWFDLMIRVNRV
jgi:hypothetical protein